MEEEVKAEKNTEEVLEEAAKLTDEVKDIEIPQDIVVEEEVKPKLEEQGVEKLSEYEKLDEKEKVKYGI